MCVRWLRQPRYRSEDLKAALEKEASADDRSVSSLVDRILRTWLEQRGKLLER